MVECRPNKAQNQIKRVQDNGNKQYKHEYTSAANTYTHNHTHTHPHSRLTHTNVKPMKLKRIMVEVEFILRTVCSNIVDLRMQQSWICRTCVYKKLRLTLWDCIWIRLYECVDYVICFFFLPFFCFVCKCRSSAQTHALVPTWLQFNSIQILNYFSLV